MCGTKKRREGRRGGHALGEGGKVREEENKNAEQGNSRFINAASNYNNVYFLCFVAFADSN